MEWLVLYGVFDVGQGLYTMIRLIFVIKYD